MKYASGDGYEGEFYHGFMFGYGKYTYANGGYYEGEFKCVSSDRINYFLFFSSLLIIISFDNLGGP
jgi:hypothetical protein